MHFFVFSQNWRPTEYASFHIYFFAGPDMRVRRHRTEHATESCVLARMNPPRYPFADFGYFFKIYVFCRVAAMCSYIWAHIYFVQRADSKWYIQNYLSIITVHVPYIYIYWRQARCCSCRGALLFVYLRFGFLTQLPNPKHTHTHCDDWGNNTPIYLLVKGFSMWIPVMNRSPYGYVCKHTHTHSQYK